MCGRYVAPDTAAIERQWKLAPTGAGFERRFNVAPAADVPILRKDKAGHLVLASARWGLVPHWWSQPRPPRFNHNARIEEAAAKPMWRDALQRWRCLMPALGWYEWRESDKQPYYFSRADGRIAALAGLLSFRDGQLTCAVLSTEACGPLADVHHRMPVALPFESENDWLESGKAQCDWNALAFHPVRRLVNSSKAEGPGLLEPA
ncbi:MAG TPA: SOS response-associated peptidase [Burkholderiales bacterium]|nr:SOS response-associated peptidase [Burkholderiales bacterium]